MFMHREAVELAAGLVSAWAAAASTVFSRLAISRGYVCEMGVDSRLFVCAGQHDFEEQHQAY
jgi:hypothetical protein